MPERENPTAGAGLPEWIVEDLAKSGLTLENFKVEPIESEAQIKSRLGFTALKNKVGEEVKIIDLSGYWIPYPGIPDFYRLKLRYPIETENGTVKYLSPKDAGNHAYILPGVEELLINYNPDKPVFITEGEKKAVKATLEGFPCIGLAGVWCFKESDNLFLPELEQFRWKHRKTYIVFDSDIHQKTQVKHAELRLAVEIINRGGIPYSIRLPNEQDGSKNGLDDYLVRYGAEEFRKLVEAARPTFEVAVSEGTPRGLLLETLVFLKNSAEIEKVLKLIAKSEGIPIRSIRNEFYSLFWKKRQEEKSKKDEPNYSKEEQDKARELLNSPDILDKMLDITSRMGLVGEEINRKVLYLAFTSRKLIEEAISCVVKGASSAGKSTLVRTVLKLFPEEDILSYSFLTPKALVHFNKDLSHKILFVQEYPGSMSADYSIRTTLTERELSIALPIKDEATGDFTTTEKRVPAVGLSFVQTTTKESLNPENQTRVFDLYVDESEEQTRRVLQAKAEQEAGKKEDLEPELRIWRCAQTLLETKEVVIPYAQRLPEAFPKNKTRVRRDFDRFLSLIKAHALLYQFQRQQDEQGRIIATPEDLKGIRQLAEVVLVQSFKELPPKQEQALSKLYSEYGLDTEFTPREAYQKIGGARFVSIRTFRNWLKDWQNEGLLEHNGEKGKKARYYIAQLHSSPTFELNSLESLTKNCATNCATPLHSCTFHGEKQCNCAETVQSGVAQFISNDLNDLCQKNPNCETVQRDYNPNIDTRKPVKKEVEFDLGDGKTKKLTFYQDGSIREQIFEKKFCTTRVINHNCPDYDDLVQELLAQLEEGKTDPWQGEVKDEQETC